MKAEEIRRDFPIFNVSGSSLVYLDSAATAQKPQCVIDRICQYYTAENANIHRGSYPLSDVSSRNYDSARETVAKWINAALPEEIIFTKSSTEAINLVAYSLGKSNLSNKANFVTTEMEHSSNYFPWKELCRNRSLDFRVVKANEDGSIDAENVLQMLDNNTKLLSISGMSNTLGFIPDLKKIIDAAHSKGALVLVDATQLIAHSKISVQKMDCDFLVFSGHKLFAPLGIGVLYGKEKIMKMLPPFLYGGDMVKRGDSNRIEYKEGPEKYEAGTQNIAGAIGLKAALDYLNGIDFMDSLIHEQEISQYMHQSLRKIKGIKLFGTADQDKAPIALFQLNGYGSYDIGVLLGLKGISIRGGAHCAYHLMERMGVNEACRASIAIYTTREDIDKLTEALESLANKKYGN